MATIKQMYHEVGFSKLLTTNQPKLEKSKKLNYFTAGLQLAPSDISGFEVCAYSCAACVRTCINFAGHGGIGLDENGLNQAQRARIARTRLLFTNPQLFFSILLLEIGAHVRRSIKLGMIPVVRLNVFSDLPWERMRVDGVRTIFECFPDVQFMDYTKYPIGRRPVETLPNNYHLTMSLADTNDRQCLKALQGGRNVAAVFQVKKGDPLPQTFAGFPVVDGDVHDLRFLDKSPAVVGLRVKGHAAIRESRTSEKHSFFRSVDERGFRCVGF